MRLKLVVNTNRLIAALIRESTSRQILYHMDADFIGVQASMKEIEKYKGEILEKAKINEEEFQRILERICSRIIFLNEELVKLHVPEANEIMGQIDVGDVVFIAAALATSADVWSDDNHFYMQKRIKARKTKDLVELWNSLKQ